MTFARVAVNRKTSSVQVFTYQIKPDQLLAIKPGSIVEVPFGKRKLLAVVVKLTKAAQVERQKLRTIERVISSKPILTTRQIDLARWLASYYASSLGEAFFAILPPLSKRGLSNGQS